MSVLPEKISIDGVVYRRVGMMPSRFESQQVVRLRDQVKYWRKKLEELPVTEAIRSALSTTQEYSQVRGEGALQRMIDRLQAAAKSGAAEQTTARYILVGGRAYVLADEERIRIQSLINGITGTLNMLANNFKSVGDSLDRLFFRFHPEKSSVSWGAQEEELIERIIAKDPSALNELKEIAGAIYTKMEKGVFDEGSIFNEQYGKILENLVKLMQLMGAKVQPEPAELAV